MATDVSEMTADEIKTLRCAHLLAADMVPSTPAISDLNEDGQLEVVYAMVWGGSDSNVGGELPPRIKVYAFTLRERVQEVYGEEGVGWVEHLLPSDKQPWPRYMGGRGDNIFRPPHLDSQE